MIGICPFVGFHCAIPRYYSLYWYSTLDAGRYVGLSQVSRLSRSLQEVRTNQEEVFASGDPTSKLWVFQRTVVPTKTAVQKS